MTTPLMTRIVFATDFSASAARAQEYACQMARAWDASVEVLHVVEGPAWMRFETASAHPLQEARRDATRRLEEVRSRMTRDGIAAEVRLGEGNASEQITAAAAAADADLVVLGAQGRTGLDYVLLGSTVERVIQSAPCPVLTVRVGGEVPGPPASIQHILAPVDFSSPSLGSLEYAIQMANRLGAKVTILHVLEPVYYDLDLGLGQIQEEPKKRAHWEAQLAQLTGLISSFGLPTDSEIVGGVPADSILACALRRRCDLVVMGTHGRREPTRMRFGSVAEAVLLQAPCPVLTVKCPKFAPGHRRVVPETVAPAS